MFLFDDYPVTETEVSEWLDAIPNLSASLFRREAYRKAYRVEEKIRAAKKQLHDSKQLNPSKSRLVRQRG